MDKFFEKIHTLCGRFIKSEKLMNLIRKAISREIFFYLLFGVLTTVVNFVVFAVCNKAFDVMISNVIAWVAAVIFAYVTNKLFVFESKSWKFDVIKKEIPSFAGARVLTLGVEEVGILVLIKWLHLDVPLTIGPIGGEIVIKAVFAVIIVVLNYVFSKLLIFKKK